MADIHHASLKRLSERVELVGFCEPRDEARGKRQAEWGLPGYADMAALLDTQKPDAVCLLLPHDQHVPAIRAAAARGVHVFLEKPIAATLEQAAEIGELVKRSGIVLLVGHNGLFHPAFEEVKEAIRRGWIGKPLFARGTSAGWLTFRPWDFRLSKARTGGGCWIDAGGHLVYCLRELLGEVERVSGITANLARKEMEGEDHACATLKYRSGALAQLFVSYGHKLPGYESDWPHGYRNQIEVFGDAGAITYTISPQPELRLYSETPAAMEQKWRGWMSRQPAKGYEHSFYAEMEHFIDCLDGRCKPKVSVADACAVLRVLLALYKVQDGGDGILATDEHG